MIVDRFWLLAALAVLTDSEPGEVRSTILAELPQLMQAEMERLAHR